MCTKIFQDCKQTEITSWSYKVISCAIWPKTLYFWNSNLLDVQYTVTEIIVKLPLRWKTWQIQKRPPRGIPRKRCSENMQQIYREQPMLKCDLIKLQGNFIEIAHWHGCSPVILLHIFRTPFLRNTSRQPLLQIVSK